MLRTCPKSLPAMVVNGEFAALRSSRTSSTLRCGARKSAISDSLQRDLGQVLRKSYLIAAVGTDIGKTFLLENLCRTVPDVMAIKPIASGFEDDDENSDSAKILRALDLENSLENINSITPWRFKEAVSPHFAAASSGVKINFSEVKKFCEEKILEAEKAKKVLFIETAGGVMTPINEEKTFLDLAAELKIPLLLVTANYLGAISHTLCAVEALKVRGVKIAKIIVNEDLPALQKSPFSLIETLRNFTGLEVVLFSEFCLG